MASGIALLHLIRRVANGAGEGSGQHLHFGDEVQGKDHCETLRQAGMEGVGFRTERSRVEEEFSYIHLRVYVGMSSSPPP